MSRVGNDATFTRLGPPSVLLGFMAGLGPFTIDSYIPAMPAIVREFASGDIAIQLTLAFTMLGFAIGQLIVGPWSDRVGRRRPLVFGMVVLAAACAGAALAHDPISLLVARFLQGIGASSSYVIALAVARDMYSGLRLVKSIGTIALIQSIAPLVAPIVGGFLLIWLDWRGVFVFLAIYAITILLLIPPRLRTRDHKRGDSPRPLKYRVLLRDRKLVVLLVLSGLRFAALYAFLQWSSFIFQNSFGMKASEFGVVFAIITLGMMLGLQLSPLAIRRGIRPRNVLWAACAVMSVAAIYLFAARDLLGVIVACTILLLGCGLGLPTMQTLALVDNADTAGTVAGLLGAVSFGSALIATPFLAFLPANGFSYQGSLAVVIVCTSVISAALIFVLKPTTGLGTLQNPPLPPGCPAPSPTASPITRES